MMSENINFKMSMSNELFGICAQMSSLITSLPLFMTEPELYDQMLLTALRTWTCRIAFMSCQLQLISVLRIKEQRTFERCLSCARDGDIDGLIRDKQETWELTSKINQLCRSALTVLFQTFNVDSEQRWIFV